MHDGVVVDEAKLFSVTLYERFVWRPLQGRQISVRESSLQGTPLAFKGSDSTTFTDGGLR